MSNTPPTKGHRGQGQKRIKEKSKCVLKTQIA
jgi:hypothetical protein